MLKRVVVILKVILKCGGCEDFFESWNQDPNGSNRDRYQVD